MRTLKKRALAMLMTLALVLGMLPTTAWAEGSGENGQYIKDDTFESTDENAQLPTLEDGLDWSERETIREACGFEYEHTHSDENGCYEYVTNCPHPEHTENCYLVEVDCTPETNDHHWFGSLTHLPFTGCNGKVVVKSNEPTSCTHVHDETCESTKQVQKCEVEEHAHTDECAPLYRWTVISTDTTPEVPPVETELHEPTYAELFALGKVVEVDCETEIDDDEDDEHDDEEDCHAWIRYEIIEGTYTTSVEQGEHGGWFCKVTIDSAEYIEQYEQDTNVTHTLEVDDGEVEESTDTIYLKWNGTEWTYNSKDNDADFEVECNGTTTTPIPPEYNITVSVTHGNATPAGENGVIKVTEGAGRKITFAPTNDTYELKSVTVDGETAELAADGSYTFENVTADHRIAVVYGEKETTPEYNITVEVVNGTADANGTVTVSAGEDKTIEFTANLGYVISSVSVNGQSLSVEDDATTYSYTFENVNEHYTIRVVFETEGINAYFYVLKRDYDGTKQGATMGDFWYVGQGEIASETARYDETGETISELIAAKPASDSTTLAGLGVDADVVATLGQDFSNVIWYRTVLSDGANGNRGYSNPVPSGWCWHFDGFVRPDYNQYTVRFYMKDQTEWFYQFGGLSDTDALTQEEINEAKAAAQPGEHQSVELYTDPACTTPVTDAEIIADTEAATGGVILKYYVKLVNDPTYTVTYDLDGDTKTTEDQEVFSDLYSGANTPKIDEPTRDDGYYFNGWSPVVSDTVTGDVTYVAQWEAKTDLTITIPNKTVSYTGAEQTGNGYSADCLTGTVKAGHTLNVPYTPASGTNAGTYENGSFGAVTVTENGADVTEQYDIDTVCGTLTINQLFLSVEIVGKTANVPYTGAEQEVKGYTMTVSVDGVAVDQLPDGVSLYLGANNDFDSAKGTDVHKYDMRLLSAALHGEKINNYTTQLKITNGYLNIYNSTELSVSAADVSRTYTGTGHSVTATASKDGAEITYVYKNSAGEVVGTPVDAGTYTVEITATLAGYENATCTAQVVITPATLKVTTEPASRRYNGAALTAPGKIEGFVNGEEATFTVTGSQTNVGSSINTYTIDWNKSAKEGNYTVEEELGTLTVRRRPTEPPVTPDLERPVRPNPNPNPRPNPGPDTNPNEEIEINDELTPLAGLDGLNMVDHFAYIMGYDSGLVRPEANITRAEVATIFFRLMTDLYRQINWATENPFTDVEAKDWFNNAVSTSASAGIVDGYPDSSFAPNKFITRAEFAKIAACFLSEEYVGPTFFTDTEGHWAEEYINRAAQAGWIDGYEDGSFRPNAYIKRAEAMKLVNAMLGRKPTEEGLLDGMKVWEDNMDTTKWYYLDVQEATNSHDYERIANEENDLLSTAVSVGDELWTALLPEQDWSALEKEWADAYDAPAGEVMD